MIVIRDGAVSLGGGPLEEEGEMKSSVVKRSIVLAGHKTSSSLENTFWEGLKDIA